MKITFATITKVRQVKLFIRVQYILMIENGNILKNYFDLQLLFNLNFMFYTSIEEVSVATLQFTKFLVLRFQWICYFRNSKFWGVQVHYKKCTIQIDLLLYVFTQ